MTNSVLAGAKSIGQHLFGGYAELLRIPHTARFSVGSVIACMPFPMVGMTITISVQHYYGNYSLAGALTAVQAIALAVASPVLGKLVDKFGQRQVSIPTIIVWMIAATALVSCITARVPSWILFCIVPFMAAIPPWGAMSRQRWTTLLKGDTEKTNRALSLSGVFAEQYDLCCCRTCVRIQSYGVGRSAYRSDSCHHLRWYPPDSACKQHYRPDYGIRICRSGTGHRIT